MRRSPLSGLCTGDCASELTARIPSQRSSIAARRPVRAGQGRPIGPLAHLPEHADAEAPSVPIWSGVAGSCPCTLSSCLDMRSPGHLRLSGAYTWTRVIGWLRRKHHRSTVKGLRRRYCGGGWWPGTPERQLFNPANALPIPGHSVPDSVAGRGSTSHTNHDGTCGASVARKRTRRVRRRLGEAHR
jgi:hypothetical protein